PYSDTRIAPAQSAYSAAGCLFWPPNRESSYLSLTWLEKGVQEHVVQIWGYSLCASERFPIIHNAQQIGAILLLDIAHAVGVHHQSHIRLVDRHLPHLSLDALLQFPGRTLHDQCTPP